MAGFEASPDAALSLVAWPVAVSWWLLDEPESSWGVGTLREWLCVCMP